MYYVHISAVPLTFFFHSLHLALYYVYVQALKTRVSEAYTELDEPTFTNEKLEVSIVFRARTTTTLTYLIWAAAATYLYLLTASIGYISLTHS